MRHEMEMQLELKMEHKTVSRTVPAGTTALYSGVLQWYSVLRSIQALRTLIMDLDALKPMQSPPSSQGSFFPSTPCIGSYTRSGHAWMGGHLET